MNTLIKVVKSSVVAIGVAFLSLAPFAQVQAADVVLASVAVVASPSTICAGQPALISWSSTDATSIWIDQGVGAVLPYGSLTVYPAQTTTYTITGTNITGGYAVASATVYVTTSCNTPTPTPTNATLYCSASYAYANSGDLITFNAWGGNGNYSWSAAEGTPSYNYGPNFSTRFYNPFGYSVNRNVTVTSGYQSATCGVTIYAGTVWTPTPTPSVPAATLIQVSKFGRNVTRGQSGENTRLIARSGDTLDFVIRVRSTNGSYLYNSYVTDILPAGVVYIPQSTTVNGAVVGDGVSTAGLNIGTVSPFTDTVIKLSARVDGAYVPSRGTITVSNVVQARADGIPTRSASLPITLGQGVSLSTVGTVQTGPADSLFLALGVAFLITSMYAAYTRTNVFGRRMAHAEISQLAKAASLNFAK